MTDRFGLALLSVLIVSPAHAQHRHSPYADDPDREIAALSAEQLEGLLSGEGLGYARAAELNGVPGPRHVLDLAEELGLDPNQRERTSAIYNEMREAAIDLGTRLVEVERRIDRGFATESIHTERLATLIRQAARLEGELRLTHLRAHLAMKDVLDRSQIERYSRLRGYHHER